MPGGKVCPRRTLPPSSELLLRCICLPTRRAPSRGHPRRRPRRWCARARRPRASPSQPPPAARQA
eukprot:9682449-Alexandrium_andersonii.AAC.1